MFQWCLKSVPTDFRSSRRTPSASLNSQSLSRGISFWTSELRPIRWAVSHSKQRQLFLASCGYDRAEFMYSRIFKLVWAFCTSQTRPAIWNTEVIKFRFSFPEKKSSFDVYAWASTKGCEPWFEPLEKPWWKESYVPQDHHRGETVFYSARNLLNLIFLILLFFLQLSPDQSPAFI